MQQNIANQKYNIRITPSSGVPTKVFQTKGDDLLGVGEKPSNQAVHQIRSFLGEHNAENPTSKGSITTLKMVSD